MVLLPPIFTTDIPGRIPPKVFDIQGQFTFSPYKAKRFDIHSGLPCRWRWGALPIHHSVTEYECYLEKEQGDWLIDWLNVLFSITDGYGFVSRLIAIKKLKIKLPVPVPVPVLFGKTVLFLFSQLLMQMAGSWSSSESALFRNPDFWAKKHLLSLENGHLCLTVFAKIAILCRDPTSSEPSAWSSFVFFIFFLLLKILYKQPKLQWPISPQENSAGQKIIVARKLVLKSFWSLF